MGAEERTDQSLFWHGSLARLVLKVGPIHPGAYLRLQLLKRVFRAYASPGCSVLDAGCGNGRNTVYLASRYRTMNFYGVDVQHQAIARARQICLALSLPNVAFSVHNLCARVPREMEERFDLAFCIDVLEHIDEDRLALANLRSMIRPEGVLILHVPQVPQRRVLGLYRNHRQADHVRDGYTKGELMTKLEECGFTILACHHTFGPGGAAQWELGMFLCARRFLKPLALVLRPLAWIDVLRLVRNRWGNGLLVVARRV